MHSLKKWIGILIAALMVFQVMPVLADDTTEDSSDSGKYSKNIQLMLKFGFYEAKDGGIASDDTMTRADFSVMLARMLKLNTAGEGTGVFKDVPETHMAVTAVEGLHVLGILSGNEGMFRPDDPILYTEAVAAFVRALGFEELSNYEGGYPTGYLSIARQKGLLSGLSLSLTDTMTLGIMARMAYNALEIDIFQVVQIGSDGTVSRQEVKGKNILSQYHGVYTIKDVINGNELTMLNKPQGLPEGYVKVGSLLLKAGQTDAADKLGYKVKAYYNLEEEILQYYEVLDGNLEVKITSSQLVGYENGEINYENNDKDYSVKIAPSANIIYNGKAVEEFDKDLYKVENGWISCIDETGDGKYETVLITNYETYIVDKVSVDNETIQLKYNAGSIPMNDIDYCALYDQDENEIDISYLLEWNVLTILRSIDKQYCKIYRSNTKKTGTVAEMSNDGKKGYIKLDSGESFEVTEAFYKQYPAVKTGTYGVFLLDKGGKAAGYKPKNDNESGFAYLIGMIKEDTFADYLNLKMYTDNSEMRIVKTGEKIIVDGTRSKTLTACSDLYDSEKNELKQAQMIRYEINEDGILTVIDTVARNDSEDSVNTLIPLKSGTSMDLSGKYYLSTTQFNGEVFLSPACKVFMLPEGEISSAANDDFSIVKPNNLENGKAYSFNAYKLSDSELEASAIIVQGKAAQTFGTYEVSSLIEKVVTAVNEKGDIVHKVTYWYQGVKKTAYTKDDQLFKDITPGDIMFLGKNAKGELSYFDLLFDYSLQKNVKGDPAPAYGAGRDYVFGYICSVYKNVYTVTKDDPASIPVDELPEAEKGHRLAKSMYVFDETKGDNKVRVGNYGDLMGYKQNKDEYYKVFIFQLYAYDYDAVIFKTAK